MSTLDAHQGGDLMLIMGANDVVGGSGEDELVGMRGDDVGTDSVDHLQGAVSGVITVDLFSANENGKKFSAEETLHTGEIRLTLFVGCGDVIARHRQRGNVVVRVDEDGIAGDAIDLGLGHFVLLSSERKGA